VLNKRKPVPGGGRRQRRASDDDDLDVEKRSGVGVRVPGASVVHSETSRRHKKGIILAHDTLIGCPLDV
jgi:hypothetical protein